MEICDMTETADTDSAVSYRFANGEVPEIFNKVDVPAILASIRRFLSENGLSVEPFPEIVFDCAVQKSFLHFCIGFYNPDSRTVTIPVADRSPNDAFRTLFHELVHHSQNLCGELGRKTEGCDGTNSDVGLHEGLTELEKDANDRGFFLYRIWARIEKGKSENPFYLG